MFRKEWLEHVEKIKAALNENPEWMETPQGKKECAAIEAVMKRLDERYGCLLYTSIVSAALDGRRCAEAMARQMSR